MKLRPDLSIVIVSWNTRELTRECLTSIYEHRPRIPFEVIVVDNGSEDDSVEMVRREFGQVRLIDTGENLLFSEGNNVGARAAEGRMLCLLNSDTRVTPGAFEAMVEFLDEHPDYATVAPKLLNPDGTVQPSCSRIEGAVDDFIKSARLDRLPPGRWWRDRTLMTSFDHESSIDAIQLMGAVLTFRTAEYLERWSLDPEMSLFFNMEDLFRRIGRSPARARYLAEAEIYHHRGGSTDLNEAARILKHRNRLSYYRKYYGRLGEKYARSLIHLRTFHKSLRIRLSRRPAGKKRQELEKIDRYLGQIFAKPPAST